MKNTIAIIIAIIIIIAAIWLVLVNKSSERQAIQQSTHQQPAQDNIVVEERDRMDDNNTIADENSLMGNSLMKEDVNTMMGGNTSTQEASGAMMERGVIEKFSLTGKNFEFSVKEIRVKKGDTVRIAFTSESGLHDWVVEEFNARTKQLRAGESETIEFVADRVGTFEYYCSVGSHRQLGMVGKLIVE